MLREVAALCGEGVAGKGIEIFPAEVTKPIPPPTIVEESEDLGDVSGQSITRSTTPLSRSTVSLVSTISTAVAPERTASIVRTTSDTAGNESIIRVAEKVCEAFGIEVVPRVMKEKSSKRRSILQGGAVEAELDGKGRFGWQALQVGVLRDAISIAEALPGSFCRFEFRNEADFRVADYQAAIRFTVTALRTLSDFIPPAEQYRLSQNIPRIFAAATRRGAAFDLEYWGPHQLVMSLEMTPSVSHLHCADRR